MNPTLLDDAVNRSNRRLLLISVVVLIGIVFGLGLAYRYYYNFFVGPFPITHDELVALTDTDSRLEYYVTVEGEDTFHTGYEYGDVDGSSVDISYLAMEIDDRWLLTEISGAVADEDTLAESYNGGLVVIPNNVQLEVINDVYDEYPDLEGVFLPYILDARDFRSPGYAGLIASAVVGLGGLFGVYRAMTRMSDPAKHPIYKALSIYGDPVQVAQQIELEMNDSHPQDNDLHWTRHWFVRKKGGTLEAVKHQDIVWMYQLTTQHRTNGIPTGKSYSAILRDRYGRTFTLPGKEGKVVEILYETAKHAPWVIQGFNNELEKSWNKQRDAMIAVVDDRRRQQTQK